MYSMLFVHNRGPQFDPVLLERRINQTSKYYDPIVNITSDIFDIVNEGKKKLVVLLGDSHARMIGSRFIKLYK